MSHVKLFENFNKKYSLTDDEKKYLWSKIEYKKKKAAKEKENDLFLHLTGDKKSFTTDEFNKILNSLEYSFKKKFKDPESNVRSELFKSIQNKLPEDWIGVKYSSLKAKMKKNEKEN